MPLFGSGDAGARRIAARRQDTANRFRLIGAAASIIGSCHQGPSSLHLRPVQTVRRPRTIVPEGRETPGKFKTGRRSFFAS